MNACISGSEPQGDRAVFEYCYRDASNYRVHEWVLLEGSVSPAIEEKLRGALIEEVWFVAENVGLPTLFHRLELYSGGPTVDDHGWHEFIGLRAATSAEIRDLPLFGSVTDLLERFQHLNPRSR